MIMPADGGWSAELPSVMVSESGGMGMACVCTA